MLKWVLPKWSHTTFLVCTAPVISLTLFTHYIYFSRLSSKQPIISSMLSDPPFCSISRKGSLSTGCVYPEPQIHILWTLCTQASLGTDNSIILPCLLIYPCVWTIYSWRKVRCLMHLCNPRTKNSDNCTLAICCWINLPIDKLWGGGEEGN